MKTMKQTTKKRKKATRKDFYMEIRKSPGRFLSILFIVALGVAFFSGIRAAEPGTYDVILMDIMMPVMDGLEATRAIRGMEREDCHTIPIVAMSANAFDDDLKKSVECGMNGHLSKPVDVEKLYQTLGEIILAK